MKIKCPSCSAHYEVDPKHIGQMITCSSCKTEFEIQNPNLSPCPDCFALISRRASVCPRCGAPLNTLSNNFNQPSENGLNLQEETEIQVCHPSSMNYLWAILFGALTSVVLIGLFILLYVWIEVHYTSYTITNLRIIIRRGWLSKYQNEIWIKDMRGANLVQSFWQRLIGIGSISIGTAATAENEIYMIGIRNPQQVVDTVNALRR